MMTMNELFYGPNEPTWIVNNIHPGLKRANGNPNNANCDVVPYTAFTDDTHMYPMMRRETRNPFMHRNAIPYTTMLAQESPAFRGETVTYNPYHHQHYGPVVPFTDMAHVHPSQSPNQKQSPARQGVMQPRNIINMQTLHLMVPMCCTKCEEKVKEELLDMDDVQRVTCDQWNRRVTVTSTVAPEKLLKRVQKIKKRSTFWPQQQSGSAQNFNPNRVQFQPINQNQNQVPFASDF